MEGKNNRGLRIIIIIMAIIIIGLCCLLGWKFLSKNNDSKENLHTNETTKSTTKNESSEELDINSRLVQSLYNKVAISSDKKSWDLLWYYGENDTSFGEDDFDISTSSELVKMQLVGKNLLKSNIESIYCSDYSIPDYAPTSKYMTESKRYSTCYQRHEYGYTKKYVEDVYKDIYGSNAELDLTVPIYIDSFRINSYIYIESVDMYLEYDVEGGGTSGPGGYTAKLEKALKNNDEINIYEIINKYSEDERLEETFKFKYTFKLDEDGMYNFISRTKEAK